MVKEKNGQKTVLQKLNSLFRNEQIQGITTFLSFSPEWDDYCIGFYSLRNWIIEVVKFEWLVFFRRNSMKKM